MPQSQLIPTMNFIAASLGKRCNFCHVNRDGQWDFAADDKPEKATAREMIKMVLDLHKLKVPGADEVSCFTCHRGQEHPVNVPTLPLPVSSPRPPAAGAGSGTGTGAPPTAGAPQPSPTAPALPSADEIFGKYIAAIGGQANIDKLKSRTTKGTLVQANGNSIPFENEFVVPDKFHAVATTPSGIIERAFTATGGWEKSSRGVRQLAGAELDDLRFVNNPLRHIKLKEQFTRTRVSKGKLADRDVYVVTGTTPSGATERLYFDIETGLLRRRVSYTTTMLGVIPNQIDFDDYRDVDGVKFPFVLRASTIEVGNPVTTRNLTEIKLNVPVDESRFTQPAAN